MVPENQPLVREVRLFFLIRQVRRLYAFRPVAGFPFAHAGEFDAAGLDRLEEAPLGFAFRGHLLRPFGPQSVQLGHMNTVRTADHEAKIVAKLARGWSVTAACKAARIGRQTYYDWREADPDFAALCDAALEDGTDMLEDSATRQAIAGNASLMTLLLKARRPAKYRERVEHSGDPAQPLTVILKRVPHATHNEDEA
jgi:hypothetical protein